MKEPNVVLRHLDVTQPHPFLRLWERWGHGDGGEWLHPAPPPRLGWDLQPERRFGDVGRRRAWGNLPRPPPGWSVPFPVDHVEPTVPVEAGRDEYTHSHVTHDTSEPPEGVDYSGTHPVRSTRALGEPHATQLDTTHETTWCEVDESQEPYTNEAVFFTEALLKSPSMKSTKSSLTRESLRKSFRSDFSSRLWSSITTNLGSYGLSR